MSFKLFWSISLEEQIPRSGPAGQQHWISRQAWVPVLSLPQGALWPRQRVETPDGDQWRHLKKSQGRWGRSTLQSSSLLFSALILVLLFQGFSVEGQENLQEILSKQLLLCQFLMALSVVRTGDTLPSPHPGPTRGPVVQEHVLGLA